MYCPTCGAEFTNGLKYCKRCGSSLVATEKPVAGGINLEKFTGMFWAIAVVGIAGLALLIGGILGVTGMGVEGKGIAVVSALVLATILAIVGMLTRQLSRLIKLAEDSQSSIQSRRIDETGERAYPRIAAPPAELSSVTEHTTRNMEPSKYKAPVARE
ncbi:MAG: hypothetical protein L0229_26330 [Blastocatellia bacterium]|nr:hypothetical protein [Blastocatellia bacterium]